MTDAREKALAHWLKRDGYYGYWKRQDNAFRAGHDHRDAEVEALRARLVRVCKYAKEDRMLTPGFTRLERAIDEARALLSSAPTPVAETEAKP